MKKIITAAALAAAAVGMATADISFGSWGRGLWITAANNYNATDDKTEIVQDVHQSWGGDAPRTALAVSGDSDNVGFKLDIHGNGLSLGMGDNAYIWVKPIEQVKLYMGKLDVNALRGDVAYGMWNWDRIGAVGGSGEGWTFPGFLTSKGGVGISANPIPELTLIADIPLNLSGDRNLGTGKAGSTTKFSDIYGRSAKYAAAYDIKDVGTFKLGLETQARKTKVGETESKENVVIDVAFDVKAVQDANFSIGASIPTFTDATAVTKDAAGNITAVTKDYIKIRLGGDYKVDALTAHFIAGFDLNRPDIKENEEDGNVGLLFGAGADYDLGDGLGVFADVRFANGIYMASTSADGSSNLVFGLGVEKGWSNGKIGIAFEGSTNGNGRYTYKANDDGVVDQFAWEIPVKFEYWF